VPRDIERSVCTGHACSVHLANEQAMFLVERPGNELTAGRRDHRIARV